MRETFVVYSSPGVGSHQQPGSKRLLHHLWVLLTDDLDVSGQEGDVSRQSVGHCGACDRVTLTCRETESRTSEFKHLSDALKQRNQ